MQDPRPARRWLSAATWGLAYGLVAIAASSVGFATALLIPNPFDAALTSTASPKETLRSRLAQGVIPYGLNRPVNVVVMGIDRVEGTEPGT
ncbi:MAG: LytR family transcriptional regulator, partial [Prochlorothrix sp.]